jgi:hypothetical protein
VSTDVPVARRAYGALHRRHAAGRTQEARSVDPRHSQRLVVPAVAALLVGCVAASVAPGIAHAAVVRTPAVDARVATAPKPSPTKIYSCARLISVAQMRKVTGVRDMSLVPSHPRAGLSQGETYCQFIGRQGALAIAVTVWTGPSRADFDTLWAVGASAEQVSGIGDAARISVADHVGGARVGGTGVGVALAETGDGGFTGLNVRSTIKGILSIVAKRVR